MQERLELMSAAVLARGYCRLATLFATLRLLSHCENAHCFLRMARLFAVQSCEAERGWKLSIACGCTGNVARNVGYSSFLPNLSCTQVELTLRLIVGSVIFNYGLWSMGAHLDVTGAGADHSPLPACIRRSS